VSLERVVEGINIHELSLAQMRISRIADDHNQSLVKPYKVSQIEWLMLSSVARHSPDGIRVTDLARIFGVKTTYVTSVLNGLRAKSYISTRFDSNDARVRLAVITKTGDRQLSLIASDARQQLLERLDGVVSARDFERYAAVLISLAKL